jgi:protein-S-isoprenylcysteine O-methyltransferase Ste14
VTFLKALAALVLFLQLPIPLYWFVLHPQIRYWRRHQKASFTVALCVSWLPVTICIILFRRSLFRNDWHPLWATVLGLALIVFEGWLFVRLSRDLGAARLIGRTEISGSGTLAEEGIYARMRHPRYVGSFLALVGACLLAGTRTTWIVSIVWAVLTWIAISLEERELRTRFGEAYERYCRRVPRFLPRLRVQSQLPK